MTFSFSAFSHKAFAEETLKYSSLYRPIMLQRLQAACGSSSSGRCVRLGDDFFTGRQTLDLLHPRDATRVMLRQRRRETRRAYKIRTADKLPISTNVRTPSVRIN